LKKKFEKEPVKYQGYDSTKSGAGKFEYKKNIEFFWNVEHRKQNKVNKNKASKQRAAALLMKHMDF
jgi:hypothetical protein